MQNDSALLVLCLDEQRYGLRLSAVERVIRVVAVTPLPSAPEIVLGVIDVRGALVPVVDVRRRFRLPPRETELSDQIVLANTARRRVALLVDRVEGVELAPADAFADVTSLPEPRGYVAGVVKRGGGMIVIHDLDTFLSLDEARRLESALDEHGGPS